MGIIGDVWDAVTGKNQANGAKDVDPYKVDPNAFNYGGQPGGAQKQAGIYGGVANNYTQGAYGNFTTAQGALDQSQQARGEQMQALALARGRANGQDLISSQITAQQQQRAAAEQVGLAASARGPAALAQAQQNRAANVAQANAQLGAQGAIAGAQEKLANQQAYAAQAAGIRAGDVGTAGTAGSIGAAQGGLGATYAGLENNVNNSQLAANINKQSIDSANYNAAKGLNSQVGAGNASNLRSTIGGLISGGAAAGGLALGGGGGPPTPAAAHGGAIHGEQPYLVGEKGPELVVPDKPGFVLTALQTAAQHGVPPTAQQISARPELARLALAAGRRACGGPMYAREDGGPMEAPVTWGDGPNAMSVQPPPANPYPPSEVVPPNPYAGPTPSPIATWGNVVPSISEQQQALERVEAQKAVDRSLAYDPTKGPAADAARKRAQDTLAAHDKIRALGIGPNVKAKPGSSDAREAADMKAADRQARFTLGQGAEKEEAQQKQAEVTAKADAKKAKPSLFEIVGDAAKGASQPAQATQIHSTYVAPQLLALPARAFGGPMTGGNIAGMGHGSMRGLGIGLGGENAGELGMGGVGGLVSGTIGHANADIGDAIHFGNGAYAREDGGPVKGITSAIADKLNALRAAAAEAIAPETKPTPRQPREAVIIDSRREGPTPHTLEVTHPNTGSAVVSTAPVGMVSERVAAAAAREDGGPIAAERVSRSDRKESGMIAPGNIRVEGRKEIKNADGSVSTVRSMSFNDGKHEVLIPTAADGKIYSDDAAIARYFRTGEHLGKFTDPETATRYAERLHDEYAAGNLKARAFGGPMLARGRKRCA